MTIARPRTTPSGPSAATTGGEIRGLTGLRIVAALWVVAFHFHFTALAGVTELVGLLGPLLTAGSLGVDLFFVLSGFVIAHTYLDALGPALRPAATARFVWARFSRMWPVYALVFHLFGAWLLVRLVFGSDDVIAFQGVQPIMSVGQWVQQLLMVQMWNNEYLDGASWVGPTWSISAEWLAYLLFPVAALVFHRLRGLPAGVLAAGAVLLMVPLAVPYLETGSPYYPWSWAVRILCGFGAGVLVQLAVRRVRGGAQTGRAASRLAVALPVLIVVGLCGGELFGDGRGGAVIVAFPLLVGAIALADRGPVRVLSRPAMVQGGRISYALYLVHIPMFELFWLAQARVPALGPDSLLGHVAGALVVLATIPVAAAAYRWVEEPSRRRLRQVALPGLGTPAPTSPEPMSRAVAARAIPAPALPVDAEPVDAGPAGAAAGGAVFTPPAPRAAGGAVFTPALVPRRAAGGAVFTPAVVPRHAAGPQRRPTLAAALINAERRRPTHRAATILHAGS